MSKLKCVECPYSEYDVYLGELWCTRKVKEVNWDGHWELAEKYGYEVLAWMPLPKPWEGDANG